MQVVAYRVIRQTLHLLIHLQVTVNLDLEASLHLLVIYFVFLACQLLLMDVDNVWALSTDLHIEVLNHSIFNQLHLFHHKSLSLLPALHIEDSCLFDAIKNFFLRRLVNVIQYFKF